MTRNEALELLRLRWRYTDQRFDDPTVDAWHEALAPWTFEQAVSALKRISRDEKRITVAHVAEKLPRPAPPSSTGLEPRPCGCPHVRDGHGHGLLCQHEIDTGRDAIARIRAEHGWVKT